MCRLTQRAPRTERCRPSVTGDPFDPSPLTARQLWALATAATRELTWGLPNVAREVRYWHKRASAIPDSRMRIDALKAMVEQRTHIDGAALFSTLPRSRNISLLNLLVAYEIIWDFLDNVNERTATVGTESGLQIHLALVDALDPSRPISNYYQHISEYDDGGYLQALVLACRGYCSRLPSYDRVRQAAIREANRGRICAINHDTDPQRRDHALEEWAAREFPAGHDVEWYELTGAASTDLTIFALFALASEPGPSAEQVREISLAYFPWISVLTAMLDSYVDQLEDVATGSHSYIGHYASPKEAVDRIGLLMRRCLIEAGSLEDGEKHLVIAASMFAMYLSKSCALSPTMREATARLIRAGGSLTRVLHPTLRLWRMAYGLKGV